MSKSKGNVVNPDEIVDQFGADTLRLYEMFIGDFEKSAPWSPSSIKGCKRFTERFMSLYDIASGKGETPALTKGLHKCIKKVTSDIDNMKFNTAIAAIMTFVNEVYDNKSLTLDELAILTKLLCPFAPHMCEELWQMLGNTDLCSLASWPEYDESKCIDDTIEIVVQICGKIRAKLNVSADATKEEVLALAKADPAIAPQIEGKRLVKEVYVPGKLVNLVAVG